MRLRDTGNYDPNVNDVVVLFNASPEPVTFGHQDFIGADFALNSVQQVSNDALVRESSFDAGTGSFSIAGRTTAVFTVLGEPEALPTFTAAPVATTSVPPIAPTSTPAAPSGASPSAGLIALGVAALAALGAGIFWFVRRRAA